MRTYGENTYGDQYDHMGIRMGTHMGTHEPMRIHMGTHLLQKLEKLKNHSNGALGYSTFDFYNQCQ